MSYAADSNMTQQFKSTGWSVEIPSNWIGEQEDTCASFWSNRGVGALQLSAYQRDIHAVTDSELYAVAQDELIENITPQAANCGDFVGLTISYGTAGKFWRKWWLRSDSLFIYVTYNCDDQDRDIEAVTVDHILSTLKTMTPAE